MYIGHLLLIAILVVILLIAYIFSIKKSNAFTYNSFGISVIFFIISLKYCYDVFVLNPTPEGWIMTWSMYFLAQNEDFIFHNGVYFGLLWGIGISILSTIFGIISIMYKRKRLIKSAQVQ